MAGTQEVLLDQVPVLVEKLEELELRCKTLEGLKQLLVEELGKARGQTKRVEQELRALKQKHEGEKEDVEGGEGDTDPIDILPVEMWSAIFDQVGDCSTLKSCYEAYPGLLEGRRTTFLFPDVVKVLAANVKEFGIAAPQQVQEEEFVTNPLLQCRLVCQDWKQSVDQFAQQESPSFTSLPEANFKVPAFQFKFSGSGYVQELRGALGTTPKPDVNPMLSRFLHYRQNFGQRTSPIEMYRFERDLVAFLKQFGSQVCTFKVNLARVGLDMGNGFGYTSLLNYLSQMPNLKELYIGKCLVRPGAVTFPGSFWYDEDEDDNDDTEPTRMRREGLRKAIKENPFPEMPSLKTLVVEGWPPAIVRGILMANPHVDQHKIIQEPECSEQLELLTLEQSNVREAYLVHSNPTLWIPATWPLAKLTLDAPNLRDFAVFRNESVLTKTLKELDLRLSGPCELEVNAPWNLPALKVLKLKVAGWLGSIDFILPLVNLEMLEVDFESESDFKLLEENLQVIKIHGYVDNLKGSNVWTLFPKLKQVKARTDGNRKWYSCTRSELQQ